MQELSSGWVHATDPGAAEIYVVAAGSKLGLCVAAHAEERLARVLVAEAHPGKAPLAARFADGFSEQLLRFPGLQVTREDPGAIPWLYWTGEGWINERSELVPDGPIVACLPGGKV